ncbi:N-ATPase subunit AtpR [Verrucomicrobiota bacterium sgz303538]
MTTMSDVLPLLFAFTVSIALGLAFFGGLWWTVLRVASGRGAAWLLPLSALVRTVVLLAGFWLISQGQAARLVACVGGWLLARWFMIRRFGPRTDASGKGETSCT